MSSAIDSFIQHMEAFGTVKSSDATALTESELIGSKQHQTLVIVIGNTDSSSVFRERSVRFVTSLNTTQTIKADVYTLTPKGFVQGVTFSEDPVDLNRGKIAKMAKKGRWAQFMILEEGSPPPAE